MSCALAILINLTQHPFNNTDLKHIVTAKSRCGQIYKDSPCLKKFIKREKKVYWAICGKKG